MVGLYVDYLVKVLLAAVLLVLGGAALFEGYFAFLGMKEEVGCDLCWCALCA